jgi:hypothetical protein
MTWSEKECLTLFNQLSQGAKETMLEWMREIINDKAPLPTYPAGSGSGRVIQLRSTTRRGGANNG